MSINFLNLTISYHQSRLVGHVTDTRDSKSDIHKKDLERYDMDEVAGYGVGAPQVDHFFPLHSTCAEIADGFFAFACHRITLPGSCQAMMPCCAHGRICIWLWKLNSRSMVIEDLLVVMHSDWNGPTSRTEQRSFRKLPINQRRRILTQESRSTSS